MSLFEKYACLYEGVSFTAEERAEIGDFVVGLLKCADAGDKVAMGRHFDKHFAYADDETMSKIGRILFYFSQHGNPRERAVLDEYAVKEAASFLDQVKHLEKKAAPIPGFGSPWQYPPASPGATASSGGGVAAALRKMLGGLGSGISRAGSFTGKNLPQMIQATMLTALAAPVVKASIDSLAQSSQLKRSLKEVLRNHPELRNDPNVAHYFQILTTFAPTVATNPLVAGNILMRLHETGPTFITPQYINELMGIQETATKEAPIQRQINTMAGAMLDVAKDLTPRDGTKKLEISFGKDPQGNPRPLELGGRVRK